jgi:hypothetical protein
VVRKRREKPLPRLIQVTLDDDAVDVIVCAILNLKMTLQRRQRIHDLFINDPHPLGEPCGASWLHDVSKVLNDGGRAAYKRRTDAADRLMVVFEEWQCGPTSGGSGSG